MTTLSELITTLKGKMLPLTGGTLSGNLEIGGNATVSGKNIVRSINGTVAGTDGNVTLNSISGNAASATKLQTSRTIAISGGATGTATGFDGSANITIPVTALDVSKATAGTLATSRGGTGRTDGKVTALATTRFLDGVGFTGAADVSHYGTCSSEAATVEKVVACSNFALKNGSRIIVRFTVTNTASNPTMNVNKTGAKNIRYRNSNISAGYLAANRTYEFVYDGSYYQVVGDIDTNTTYSKASNAEAVAGTNDTKYMTPLRVKEAVAQFSTVKTVNGNSPNSDGNVSLNLNYLPLSGGTLSGNLNVGGCQIHNANSLELITYAGANYGGFIDFHFNGSTEDYTSRIIEDANSRINIYATNGCCINGNNVVRSVNGVGAGTDGNVSISYNDLSNKPSIPTTPKAYVSSTWKSGNNWYRKWSDGWIEQGGRFSTFSKGRTNYAVPTIASTQTITFHTSFSNSSTINIYCTYNKNDDVPHTINCMIKTVSTASTVVQHVSQRDYDGSSSFSGTWYACGY